MNADKQELLTRFEEYFRELAHSIEDIRGLLKLEWVIDDKPPR